MWARCPESPPRPVANGGLFLSFPVALGSLKGKNAPCEICPKRAGGLHERADIDATLPLAQ